MKVLARQHQEAIWARQATVNRLRSLLVEFYPNVLKAFPNLLHKAALEVIGAAPAPTAGAKLTRSRVEVDAGTAQGWLTRSCPNYVSPRFVNPNESKQHLVRPSLPSLTPSS